MRLRFPKRAKVDRAAYPLDYTGPATPAGLDPGTPCRILRTWAGAGVIIATQHGQVFTVARAHVRRP